MARYRNTLPQLNDDLFLVYVGVETDLLFTQGVDLPGFASYPLLETQEGCDRLNGYFQDLIDVGKSTMSGSFSKAQPGWPIETVQKA